MAPMYGMASGGQGRIQAWARSNSPSFLYEEDIS
eukprot:CAMPEP_0168795164 /NCGR_PEP_ID=MMETSP0725-20121227/16037_1 /TAXON_ID=265536 /ORGANISM="Amphiprora sp., Strain CCMP467" /LENGTH=33 /DNA_ID= /DNA_START= /DNA_END= /DNA_ORIENTATION=